MASCGLIMPGTFFSHPLEDSRENVFAETRSGREFSVKSSFLQTNSRKNVMRGPRRPRFFREKWLACSAFLVISRSNCACDHARSVIFGHRASRNSNPSRIFGSVAPGAPLCSRILGETARRGVARSTIFGKSAQRAPLRSGIFGQNGCLWPFYPRIVVQVARRGPLREDSR